jgi:hypothetical protein
VHFGQYQKTFAALVTGAIGWASVLVVLLILVLLKVLL